MSVPGTNSAGQFSGSDSLESLGLVDPASGKALPTSDWSPGNTPSGQSGLTEDEQFRYNRRDDLEDQQQVQGEQPGNQWDSDDNPYKQQVEQLRQRAEDPARQAREQFQTQQTQIDTQAQQAYFSLVQSGMPADQAGAVVQAARQAAIAQAQMQADRMALLPAAKREVSERIAREFSLPNAKIDPKEILSEGSVDAMRARAKALQESRRGQAFTARSARGADRVERGAGPGTRIDYDNMSSGNLIKLGMARGQYS